MAPGKIGLVAHLITVPHGFTVAVAGIVAQCVGRHGFPGFLELEPNIDRPSTHSIRRSSTSGEDRPRS